MTSLRRQANSPATGAPAITGTARVGETLTADTSGIADADGLAGATFSYQWLADDAGIAGATGSAYTLATTDRGKAVKVRVSFTDDAGHGETLTSAATAAVAAKPPEVTGVAGNVRPGRRRHLLQRRRDHRQRHLRRGGGRGHLGRNAPAQDRHGPGGVGREVGGLCQGGSGTKTLTFTHTVVEPNISTQGIAVLENTLATERRRHRVESHGRRRHLSHTGLAHDADHKVDWRAPAPTVAGGDNLRPRRDDTYDLGDVITITVTFDEAVDVDASGGAPRLKIDMDPAEWGEKWASYQGGSGTATLTFAHTVAEPNVLDPGRRRAGEHPGTERRRHRVEGLGHRRRPVP